MANNAHELDGDEGALQSSGDKTIERSPVSGTKGERMNLLTRLCLLCRDGSRFRRRLLLKGPTSQRWERVVTFFNSLRGIAERRQSDAAWRVREMNVCLNQSEWNNVQEVVLRDNNCTTERGGGACRVFGELQGEDATKGEAQTDRVSCEKMSDMLEVRASSCSVISSSTNSPKSSRQREDGEIDDGVSGPLLSQPSLPAPGEEPPTAPSQEDEALERRVLPAQPPALGQNVSYRLDKVGAREKKVDQRVCMSLLRAKIKCASSCVGMLRCVPRFFFWCVVCDAVSAEHPDALWRVFKMCVCVGGRREETGERRSCTQKPSRSQEIMVMSKVDTFKGVHHLTEQTLSPTSPIF